jgi:hypothetical protein
MIPGLENTFAKTKEAVVSNQEVSERHEKKEHEWQVHDSSLENFGSSFIKTLPSEYTEELEKKIVTDIREYGEPFVKYIEDTLSSSTNIDRVAIEFGGPGSNLFQGFQKDFFAQTMGVCLDDVRSRDEVTIDNQNHHTLLAGDFVNGPAKELYAQIERTLYGKKVDLILSRMMGPAAALDSNPAIMERIIQKWYSMLNENGLIFAQFEFFEEHKEHLEAQASGIIDPPELMASELHVANWAHEVQKKFPEIEIQYGRGVIRIHKKPGAPDELPPLKEIQE